MSKKGGEESMERPCGGYDCARYVERCGGDPSSPSDYICMGCGAEGPMNWYYNQRTEAEDGDDEE